VIVIAEANDLCGNAHGDCIIGDGVGHHGTCAYAVATDLGKDSGSVSNPGVLADRHARPDSSLLADRQIEPIDSVLTPTLDNRNVGPKQHIVIERDIT